MAKGRRRLMNEKSALIDEQRNLNKIDIPRSMAATKRGDLARVAYLDAKLRFASKEEHTAKSGRDDVSTMLKDFMDIYKMSRAEAMEIINKAWRATRKI